MLIIVVSSSFTAISLGISSSLKASSGVISTGNTGSSVSNLVYKIGGSKQCLANHGVNATIFGYPLNLGSDNPSIVNVVVVHH